MGITLKMDVNTKPLDGLEAYMAQFPQKAAEVGAQVYAEIRPHLLNELRFYPPVPPGSRYKRTLRLRNAWEVTFESTSEGFRLGIRNGMHYAARVVGSLAQNIQAAARFQRDFHARHGWVLATKTATFWFDAFVDEFTAAFMADIGEFASTTTTRRAGTRV